MRRLLRDLRARIERRARAWIRRRQGADTDPVELRRQRIYILPTRLGVAYGAMLCAMLLGGMNYNNNLGLGLTFLLVSLGLVTMHHAHGTLAGVRLRLLEAVPGFVGSDVRFRLLLEHSSNVARPALEIGFAREEPGSVTADLPARGSSEATLVLPAQRRGRVALERFIVSTSHPFGLFRAWAVVHPAYSAIAWPRARGARHDSAADRDGHRRRAIRRHRCRRLCRPAAVPGRRLAAARGMESLCTRPGPVHQAVRRHRRRLARLRLRESGGASAESRLEQLCRWVLDAQERGEAFALRLPGTSIETNVGPPTANVA